MKFRTNMKRAALAATIAVLSQTTANATDYTWVGGSNDMATTTNWSPNANPHINTQLHSVFFGATGSATPTLTADTNFWVKQLKFNSGAQAYTINALGGTPAGNGGSGTYISLNGVSATAPAGNIALQNASNQQQVINFTSGTSNFGITGIIDTGTVSGGSLVINAPLVVGDGGTNAHYTELTGSNNIYFNVDSTINAAGTTAGGAWTQSTAGTSAQNGSMYGKTKGRFFLGNGFSGTAYMGNLGTTYTGTFHINSTNNGAMRLTHNNSLGAQTGVGLNTFPGVTIYGGTTGNGTLEFTNNISVGRSVIFMDGRSGAVADDPHMLNVSGNNTLTVASDWDTGSVAPKSATNGSPFNAGTNGKVVSAGNWNLQSDAGTFTINGGFMYNTENVAITAQLRGAGNGVINAPIAAWHTGPSININKTGAGTWTLTNIPIADGVNILSTPTANKVSVFKGNVTVSAGTLAISGAGASNQIDAPTFDVRAGANLDVSGRTTGELALTSLNTMFKGAGTVVGSLATASGNTIAPGDSGTGTLHISNALTLNSSAVNFELTSNPGGTNDKVQVSGNLTLSGTTAINVSPLNGALGSGTYNLFTYGGSLTGSAPGNLSLSGTPVSPRQSFNLDSSTANQVNLVVTGSAGNLTWVGGVNGDIWVDGLIDSNSINWSGHPTDNHFYNGDNVTFGSTGTNTVNVSGTVAPGSVSFANGSGQNYTISGGTINSAANMTFSGAGNVQMNNGATSAVNMTFGGTGTVNLNNSSTVATNMTHSGSGAVNLTSSDVAVSGAFSSTGSGNVTISGGNFSAGSFAQNGTGAIIFANTGSTLTLPSTLNVNSGVVAFNRGDDFTLTSVLSGAGTFRKDNSNSVALSANNTPFTGTALVTAGNLKIAGPNALTNTTVQNGATLYFDTGTAGLANFGASTKVVSIVGTGSGAGSLVAAPTSGTAEINAHIGNLILTGNSKITAGNNGGTGRSIIWVDGPITGNGNNLDIVVETVGVGKNTANEIDLLNAGVTNLNNISVTGGGAVYVGQNTDLGSTGVATLGDGVTSGRIGIYTPQSGSNGSTVAFNKSLSVPAGAVGGLEVYFDASMSIGSPIAVDTGGRFDTVLYTRTNGVTSKVTLTGNITGNGGFGAHLDANATATRLGLIELTSNNNTYSGGTTIGGAGGITNLATPNNDRITLSLGNGGTTGSIGTGDITVMDFGVLLLNRSDNISFSNRITGTGVLANKAGITTITNTLNDYTGGTVILGGTLKPAAANVLGTGLLMFGDTVTADTGTFDNNGFDLNFPQLVSQSVSTTANHLLIGSGNTVTIAGTTAANIVVIGGLTIGAGSRLDVSGAGTLAVNDSAKNIVVASRNTAALTQSTLDLSGLANFTASVANIYVARPSLSTGGVSTGAVSDTLTLAGLNNITVAGRIAVGGTNTSLDAMTGTIHLGQSNTINADNWVVGSARVSGTVNFNTGLTNPTATLYGATGVGSRTNITLGDQINSQGSSNGSGGSTPTLGTMDFTAGTVTAFVENLTVGVGGATGSGFRGLGDGLFKFGGAGSSVDVNTLVVGSAANTTTASANAPQATTSNSTLEISGGSLVVNTALTIAKDNDTTNTTNGVQDVTGTLSVIGGAVTVGSVGTPVDTVLGSHINDGLTATGNLGTNTANLNITGGSYTSNGHILQGSFGTNVGTVNLNGGTLNMVGHSLGNATAISNLNLMSGTLSNVGQINNGLSGLTKSSAGTLILSGSNTYTGNTTVNEGTLNITGSHTTGANYTVASGANLITNNVRATGTLTVDGTATINTNGGTAGASKVETFAIGAGGKLNLKDNDLIVGTAADVTAVRAAIKTGVAGAAGITSDLPAFGVTTGFGYALGNDANISPLLAGSLTGQSYDADSVLVKYTYLGDADLDGDSDLNDLGLWAQSFTGDLGNPAIPATFWTSGDFDYDGDTDLNDLGFWASTFTGDLGGGAGSLIVVAPSAPAGAVAVLNGMGITVVPEPSTFVLAGVGLAGLAIAARRQRRA